MKSVKYCGMCGCADVGEAKASYVVLGINYPISRQAVAPSYAGELVIPSV